MYHIPSAVNAFSIVDVCQYHHGPETDAIEGDVGNVVSGREGLIRPL
jgi:hypothetical protein